MSNSKTPLRRLLLIQALASVAANLLTLGIFFYTCDRLKWTLSENLQLSAGVGAVYIVSALLAYPVSRRIGPRATLFLSLIGSGLITATTLARPTSAVVALAVLGFVFLNTMIWPILEGLVSSGANDADELSRRIALYNLTWSSVSAAVVGFNGLLIEHFPNRFFVLPVVCSAAAGLLVLILPRAESRTSDAGSQTTGDAGAAATESVHPDHAPEPALLRQRKVALWLSRLSMPAMYTVTYALAAMMPSLHVIAPLRPAVQTALCCVWLIVRFIVFAMLGATVFWHTRPRLLLVAGAGLLVSFLAITVPPSALHGNARLDLPIMLIGQMLLGAACGMIYAASLYFGMALTHGSAESGGYHEALIGCGMTLGPVAALVMQQIRPGDVGASVPAVAGIVAITLVVCTVASIRLRASPSPSGRGPG